MAVVVGVIVSALAYAWNNARRIHAVERMSHTEEGAKVWIATDTTPFAATAPHTGAASKASRTTASARAGSASKAATPPMRHSS